MKENGEKEWLKKLLNNEPAGEKPEKSEPVSEELEDDEEEDFEMSKSTQLKLGW